jgi:hypothetical protein
MKALCGSRILHSQFCILQFFGGAQEVSPPARIFR